MARIVVLGGGLCGLSTGMLLALDGHEVTVLERDPAPPPDDPEAAWARWERRGVSQFRMLHLLLPRWRELVETELPELAATFEAMGALRYNLVDELPVGELGARRVDDDRFTCLTGRRPTIETAVARVAERTYGLEVRRGVAVAGLLTGVAIDGVERVTGVRTAAGADLAADLVVDCGGRRSPLPGLLADVGVRPPAEEVDDSGFVYYARHFRSADGTMPEAKVSLLQPYESVSVLTLPADNGTWGVGIIAAAGDAALRGLRDAGRWHTAIAGYPDVAHWAEGEPISDVDTITKIEDRRRRYVVDESPVAVGIAAVGDAWACTNPSLGRGASIGLLHACALRDLLREVPASDPIALARSWDEVTDATVGPWYEATRSFDRSRLAEIRAHVDGADPPTDAMWDMTSALRKAASVDLDAFRAFAGVTSVLTLPEQLMADPDLFGRVLEIAPTVSDPVGLPRDELIAVAAGRHRVGLSS